MILKTGLSRFQIRREFYHNTALQLLKIPVLNSPQNYADILFSNVKQFYDNSIIIHVPNGLLV